MITLHESLDLVWEDGTISAYHKRGRNIHTRERVNKFGWNLSVYTEAPGASGGSCTFSSEEVYKLIQILTELRQKMQFLESQSFVGTFSKSIRLCPSLTLGLSAQDGRAWLTFDLFNGMYGVVRPALSIKQVEVAISRLRTAEQRGNDLIHTLQTQADLFS